MNRTLSRTILGLLVLVATGIVTGGAAQPVGASQSAAASAQVMEPPTYCLLEKNIGACVTCCKQAVGDEVPPQACAHFCRFPPPPLSGPDPQP